MSNYAHWFIRARLKTRQLLLMVALSEEGNIHRAADILSITQPAASKLLKDLEDVLGVSLFDRHSRGMTPTWYGQALIRHSRAALSNLIETTAVLFITKMVVECDALCLLAADVASYYESLGVVRVVPVDLPCNMDAFGIISRTDLELSPAARLLMDAVRRIVPGVYGGAAAGIDHERCGGDPTC